VKNCFTPRPVGLGEFINHPKLELAATIGGAIFTGDIVHNGYDRNDWKVWDTETSVWRERNIPVYPALGNHDLHGDEKDALANYFQRFPDLKNSRYYYVRAANMLVLGSSLDESSGPQGEWLVQKLDSIPADVDFVLLVFHHPRYTSSSDAKMSGGGHSARKPEQKLAAILEFRTDVRGRPWQ